MSRTRPCTTKGFAADSGQVANGAGYWDAGQGLGGGLPTVPVQSLVTRKRTLRL